MPAFKYKAIDQNGIEISGSIEGDTERHVRSILREKKLIPLLIKIINKEKSGKLRFSVSRNTLSGVELAYFTRQLATLIKSGIPIDEALFAINEQNKKQHISDIILTIRSKILEGFTLSSSLADFPQSFPLIYSTTVSAGEQSGHLSLILEKLADFIESKQKLNQQIKNALIYPSALIVTALMVIAFMLAYVVPKVVYIFENFDQQLPLLTRIMIATSDFLINNWLLIIATSLSLFLIVRQGLKNEKNKIVAHNSILKLPIFGRLVRNMNSARFMQTLSILTSSGVPILDALKIASNVITNLPMKRAIEETTIRVSEGESISMSLSQAGLFPSLMIHMIGSGENSGRLDEMLDRATSNQEQEVENTINILLGIMQPLTVIIMAMIVLLIVLAILLPIFEINNLIA
ncbi:MAG: type II secretion system inner membrane protein GspF [Woeseiaceae bacterium]|jgi:general secretion pathway protein F|nr:type II secretion system inner membrane protein GspF [Woeseiaceae bacterium]MDG1865990.1 type II secretion system inner membrane protein GspF [Woeseiaceae bacterium]|tara:strand:- start:584 stop:1798 length:1215 start_codon:yes stop_codon:yes gene_type:complete